MVPHEGSLVARIFANIFIWSFLVYGLFFLVIYHVSLCGRKLPGWIPKLTFKQDYILGFWLSFLSASLGVAQFQRKVVAFQWIFAFVIMATLFSLSFIVGTAVTKGRELPFGKKKTKTADAERAPLLADDNQQPEHN